MRAMSWKWRFALGALAGAAIFLLAAAQAGTRMDAKVVALALGMGALIGGGVSLTSKRR
jgi:hypothetical protein